MKFKLSRKIHIEDNIPKAIKQDDESKDDYISKSMGAIGSWQLMCIAMAALTRLLACWNSTSVLFLTPKTTFCCKSLKDNVTATFSNNTCYENCLEYEYVKDGYTLNSNFITDFGLICDKTWMASFIQSIMMIGIVVGVSFYGWLSDRFGRAKGMVACCTNCIIFMFSVTFCRSYWSVIVVRFFIGIGTGGVHSLSAVYCSEIVGATFVHVVLCTMIPLIDAVSMSLMTAFAYYSSTWQVFTLVYSFASLISVAVTFFLPETPRWLIAKNKEIKALNLMTRAVMFNSKDSGNIQENISKALEHIKCKKESDINLTYLDLFRTRKLAIWTIAMWSVWFVTGFTYYGLLQYASQFGSNLYVSVPAMGFSHLVTAPIAVVILRYCRRKQTTIVILLVIIVTSTALAFTSKESTTGVILGGIDSGASTLLFAVVYVYVMEIYPTPARNMGLSFCSVGSKGGAVLAPFVVYLENHMITSLIFVALSMIGAAFCLLLPETKGKSLKDSISDVE